MFQIFNSKKNKNLQEEQEQKLGFDILRPDHILRELKNVYMKDVDLTKTNVLSNRNKQIMICSNNVYKQRYGLHVGSAYQIASEKFAELFCAGVKCDACGKILLPWESKHETLCEECRKKYESTSHIDEVMQIRH